MTEPLSPYVPPHPKAPTRQRQAPFSFVVLTIALCGLNFILGGINCQSDADEFTKWGAYCGEFVVLVTWFAWGMGTPLNRLATASWMGIPWMLASWLGFAVAKPGLVLAYSHEFSQMFNVVPLAFVMSSVPLLFIRRHFRFEYVSLGNRVPYRNSTGSFVVLGIVAALVCGAYVTDRWLLSDVGLSFMIAIVLGAVATISAPLLSIALLGPKPKLTILIPAFILLPLPGVIFSRFFGMPGPGAAGAVFATLESILAAVTALGPIVATYWYWRLIGIRLNTRHAAQSNDVPPAADQPR